MSFTRFICFLCAVFTVCVAGNAQPIYFQHINSSDGLSNNNVASISIDKNGFIWIGTTDGLNIFDGSQVISYFREQEPGLPSNNILHLVTDSANRTWIGTPEGACWVDGQRTFHRVLLQDSISKYNCYSIFNTRTYGIVLHTNKGEFYFNDKSKKWEKINWIPENYMTTAFLDAEPFDTDKIIFVLGNEVKIIDYSTHKILFDQTFDSPVSTCRVSDTKMAVGQYKGIVRIVDINTHQTEKQFVLTNESEGEKIISTLTEVRCAVNGDLLVATNSSGLIIINKSGNIQRYIHSPTDAGSVAANNTYRVLGGKNGEVIVSTTTSGISFGNILYKRAGLTRIFTDRTRMLYDNYVNAISEDKGHTIWMAAYDRLIRWNKESNLCDYYYYYSSAQYGRERMQLRSLCFDKRGRLWVSIIDDRLAIFNEKTKRFFKVPLDTTAGPAVKETYIHSIISLSDGSILACNGNGGIFSIDPDTYKVNTFADHPLLQRFTGKRVISLLEDSKKRIWIGTGFEGVFCYDPQKNELKQYTIKEGLVANVCYGIKEGRNGNVYIATTFGFSIIKPDGTISSFGVANGLRYGRCYGFLEDEQQNIWIANQQCLIKYVPSNGLMQYFDEDAGISSSGFRIEACYRRSNGELLWAAQEGINHFFPGELLNRNIPLSVLIYKATLPDSAVFFDSDKSIRLPYNDNTIEFQFTTTGIRGTGNTVYRYMLEGYDKTWLQGDIRTARYSSLQPGNYIFKVSASMDGIHWTNASNAVYVYIIPPFWQRWWFIALVVVLITGIIYWYISSRNKKIREQKEELETEQAINYFASSLSEQQSEEEILWDVAKNCIGRLQFEDCVIYLLDEEKDVLIQKSAYGPKSPGAFEITKPLGIPIGKGIVGSVAFSGRAEIVKDTTQDSRYIMDDQQRFSEISVPIIYNGKVLGVIDCEHSKKGFFTQKHLSILTTIASLCANKIIRVRAEDEKQKAQRKLMDTQQKMSEVEMQALRAQMNPHFIFNCLNSINRYIVKSDQATASLYLTRFAKLIRLILDNSNSKNVTLSNELEALKLYIEMESLRFDKKFSYNIIVDSNIGADTIEVPPLIIQPYVENAIWHGLLHKEIGGVLTIHISLVSESMLRVEVEDNGVGRDKAAELKSKSATSRKSLGMKLTENRLTLMNKHAELNASIDIVDLKKENGEPTGTKVILMIPV